MTGPSDDIRDMTKIPPPEVAKAKKIKRVKPVESAEPVAEGGGGIGDIGGGIDIRGMRKKPRSTERRTFSKLANEAVDVAKKIGTPEAVKAAIPVVLRQARLEEERPAIKREHRLQIAREARKASEERINIFANSMLSLLKPEDVGDAEWPKKLHDGINAYVSHAASSRRFSIWTMHTYKTALGFFLEWLIDVAPTEFGLRDFDPLNMTLADADKFKAYLSKSKKPAYANSIVTICRSVYSFLVLREYATRNPFVGLEPTKVDQLQRRDPPTREQVMAVANSLDETDPRRTLILLGFFAGLRRSEIASIKRASIKTDEVEGQQILFITVMGKGYKERTTIVYDSEAAAMILKAVASVTAQQNLVPFYVDTISHIVNEQFDGKFTTHSLRHGYATGLSKMGIRIEVIAELLGHANIQTTRIYTHIDRVDALKEIMSKRGVK